MSFVILNSCDVSRNSLKFGLAAMLSCSLMLTISDGLRIFSRVYGSCFIFAGAILSRMLLGLYLMLYPEIFAMFIERAFFKIELESSPWVLW